MKFSQTNNIGVWLAACALISSAACSSNNNNQGLPDARPAGGDAGSADAQINADAAIPAVNVTVIDPKTGIGAATVGVIFQNPDGTLILRTTDAFGATSAVVQSGASVTAVQNGGPNSLLRSILAIEPGDDITFGAGLVGYNNTNGEGVNVTVPAPPVDDTGELDFTCTCCETRLNNGLSAELALLSGCTEAEFAAATVTADDNDFVNYLAPSALQAVAANGDIELSGSWLPSPETDLTISNLVSPALVQDISVAAIVGNNELIQIDLAGPSSFQSSVMVTHHVPPLGDRIQTAFDLSDGHGGDQLITVSSATATSSIDGSSVVLPWLDDPAATYDSTTREVSWTQTGAGSADYVLLDASYQTEFGNQGADWQIVAPAGAASVVLPQLPSAYSTLDPTDAEVADGKGFSIVLIGNQPVVPYATIRQAPVFDLKDSSALTSASWSTGSFTLSGGFH